MFKKIIAMMLAVMTVFSLSSVAFAVETVDNTFDHFTPEPGVEAPDDWYDPYCYESDGRINRYCLNQGGEADEYVTVTSAVAMYCPEHKKIFTVSNMGRKEFVNKPFIGEDGQTYILAFPPNTETFHPYEVECKDWDYIIYDGTIKTFESFTQWFCPYCGKYEIANYVTEEQDLQESAIHTHQDISSVEYGFNCDICGNFIVDTGFAEGIDELNPLQFRGNYNYIGCLKHDNSEVDINTVKLYRFLTEKHRNSDYSFIFAETEKDFGDGKDGRTEDIKNPGWCYYIWDSPDNPYGISFQDKMAIFFDSLKESFAKLISFFNDLRYIFSHK